MKITKILPATIAAVLVVSAVCPARAQETDQQKAMEAYLKNMAVNENHARLQFFAGVWDVKTTSWMMPGASPEVSQNSCQARSILGGRFILTEFKGTMMGQPFEGVQIVGFDNMQKNFVTFWIDSSSTSFFLLTGTSDPAGKVFADTAQWADPMTGGTTPVRAVTTILGPDEYRYEMYMGLPEGSEFKSMENIYTRRK
ncbi:MAG: DUF1579 domain-containing protein [Candidatus Aminicenantes bacterium]|nr:DUF1579 domain-containing protein [Candidatus Aminicenantes bacterium]